MRVSRYLSDQQVSFEQLVHPPAYTARKRAMYLHVSGRLVAKAVLLKGPESFVLAVLPSTHHVDTQAVAREIGSPVRLATEAEVAAVFHDCEWGVVGPFGTLYGLPVLIDASFDPETWLVFEAHTHAQAVRMRCRDYELLEQPKRCAFAVASMSMHGKPA